MADPSIEPNGPFVNGRAESDLYKIETGKTLVVNHGVWKTRDGLGNEKPLGLPRGQDSWIAYTSWDSRDDMGNGDPISLLQTTWTVPDLPRSGKTIFLFSAVETDVVGSTNPYQGGRHILQAVLQWGQSPAGGEKDSWSIVSWFAGKPWQKAACTVPVEVKSGDILTSRIELHEPTNDYKFTYDCGFVEEPKSKLTVEMPPAFQCFQVLEAYNVKCSDYPNEPTIMEDIRIRVWNGREEREPHPFEWKKVNRKDGCGQEVVVENDSPTQVEIRYNHKSSREGRVIRR